MIMWEVFIMIMQSNFNFPLVHSQHLNMDLGETLVILDFELFIVDIQKPEINEKGNVGRTSN